MGIIQACISSDFQLAICFKTSSPLHRNTYLTPFPTLLYHCTNKYTHICSKTLYMRVDRLTPLFYIPTSWAQPHVYTHTPKWASRGAALLRLPERVEQLVGLLCRGGPDAAGLTPRRHSSWNTPGLSVQTFFNLICIRPSLDQNMLRGGGWQRGCGQKKTTA